MVPRGLLPVPDDVAPDAFQAAYAKIAAGWALSGRADELEAGPPEEFWDEVVEAARSPQVGSASQSSRKPSREEIISEGHETSAGVDVASLVKQLEFFAGACAESRDDLEAIARGQRINYHLDFSLLAPILFRMPSEGSNDFLVSTRDATRRILDIGGGKRDFQLVVSGFTVWEFFDQIRHQLEGLSTPVPELYAAVDTTVLREELLTSDQLRQRLYRFTEAGLDQTVRAPVERMLSWVSTGVIRGIGDVVDLPAVRAATDSAQFNVFLQEHMSRRLAREHKRKRPDSEFHYKMDAGNACLTLAAANAGGPRAYFVTTTGLNRRQCQLHGENLARFDKTPLFVRNACELRDARLIDNELELVDQVAEGALEHAERLRHLTSLDDGSPYTRRRFARFYHDDVMLLAQTVPVDPDTLESQVEDIVRTLADPHGMRDAVREATEDVKRGARELESQLEAADLDYIDEFDLAKDPVMLGLKKRLGLRVRTTSR
jgi:hypothetical protein